MSSLVSFFHANGFMLELMASTVLFAGWLDRRTSFGMRLAASAVALIGLTVVWSALIPENTLTLIARYMVFFAALTMAMHQCLAVRWSQALFYMVAAGTLQHFAFRGGRIMAIALQTVCGIPASYIDCVYLVLLLPMYGIGYLAFVRPLRGRRVENFGFGMILPLLAGMSLCVSVFTNVFNTLSVNEVTGSAYTVFALFDLVNCMFLLALLREIVDREKAEEDSSVLQGLLEQQKAQLESSKETIDLINVKTHDLKKQLATFGDRIDPDEIEEMSGLIDIYDSSVQTGNEALDVLLKQKSLACERRGIQFNRMIDGSLLTFMRPADIYALFGNALDNAVEANERIDDREQRYIDMDVRMRRGMVAIRVENPYVGDISFQDGLPRTTKNDERYHGFGTRSIRMIVEHYGGYMTIDADEDVFLLSILLPVHNGAA